MMTEAGLVLWSMGWMDHGGMLLCTHLLAMALLDALNLWRFETHRFWLIPVANLPLLALAWYILLRAARALKGLSTARQ